MKVSLALFSQMVMRLNECLTSFEKECPEGADPFQSFVSIPEAPGYQFNVSLSSSGK